MAAYVEHTFKRGFLLDEERLRKLNSIIQERLAKHDPPLSHTFRIYRADSYSYETQKVDDVTREDNADWQHITRLQIKTEQKDVFEFKLSFSEDGTFLKMVGNDRDDVFLLFSDLREYMENEINTGFRFNETTRRMLLLGLPTTLMALFAIFFSSPLGCQDPSQRRLPSSLPKMILVSRSTTFWSVHLSRRVG